MQDSSPLGHLAEADLQIYALWQVSSCFSQLLNLHNLSEEISSAQLERAVRIGEVSHRAKARMCKACNHVVCSEQLTYIL